MPAYAMGPRATMKPSGAPMKRKSTHARRRARARFGRLRLGPRGSFHEGRGRFREPAIRTRNTRIGIDKGDGDNIRNDKRPPATRANSRSRFPDPAREFGFLRTRRRKDQAICGHIFSWHDGISRISPRAIWKGGLHSVRCSGFWASSIAVIVILTTLTILPSFGGSAAPSGTNPPLRVHLSYLNDPTMATITWYTTATTTSRAEWGRSIGPPYLFHASGVDYASPGGTHLHVVNLTGLTPGATYSYRIGDAGMTSSFRQATFRAAPPKGASDTFTFAAAGDSGDTNHTAGTSSGMTNRKPDLVLPVGDLYYPGQENGVRSVYDKWSAFGAGSFVQSAMGNHEEAAPASDVTPLAVHCAFSNLPGNERTYAFTWGNTFFVTLDFGADGFGQLDGVDGTVQGCDGVAGTAAIRAWVDAKLAAADADPSIRWIVVYFHFMCYDPTTTGFSLLCPIDGPNDQIEDILTNRHVDLVLYGHDHVYGRTYPVHFQTVSQTGDEYSDPGAPIYLILGTGGRSGARASPAAAWGAARLGAPPGQGLCWGSGLPTPLPSALVV